ncbi:MAG: type II secretion system secretin GspD [Kiritimatiellae bacterium]|nr:type II secretion system secretin GspD [Kiritimatiellia bacterium]
MNGWIQRSMLAGALLTVAALLTLRLLAQTDAPPAPTNPPPADLPRPLLTPASPPRLSPPAAEPAAATAAEMPAPPEQAAEPVAPTSMPTLPVPAAAPAAADTNAPQRLISLSFQDAPVDQILALYSELTGRTMIKAPGVQANITIRSHSKLTEEEVRQAIEAVLALNNISFVPLGEKFYKVVQPPAARQEGMPIRFPTNAAPREGDFMVSQIVELKHAEISEVMTLLQTILHAHGKVQPLERANAIMITDSESNVARALELIAFLDRPAETKVETRIYELREAAAADVAQRLNELISDTSQQRRPTVTIVQPAQPTPPGVIRPPSAGTTAVRTDLSLAERGIVVGQVKIVPDERTNVLIIISDPANFPFFDNMIAVLDRAVEPETLVKVYALEYAAADEIADLLSALIGSTTSLRRRTTTGATGTRTGTTGTRTTAGGSTTQESRSQTIREFIQSQISRTPTPASGAAGGPEGEGVGELSSETRILPDLRSNSILLMGRRTDLTVLEEVIRELDVMLAQVVIEAVIIEVSLSDETTTGLDWLQRSLQAYSTSRLGPGGGIVLREPVMSWGGGFLSGATAAFRSGAEVGRDVPLSAGALTYYLTLEGVNLDAVIRLAARDSRARILSTPIILTTDNTEARIVAGEERPIVTATTVTVGGNQTSAYEYKNIGIELTVKPRINPQRVVVMEVTQTADNVGDIVVIDGNEVPVVTKRELKANLAVEHRSTIVMGGLVSQADRDSSSKIPVLGDIPLLGRLFRSDSRTKQRTELLVLLTPYVVRTPQEARAETRRIHDASNADMSRWFEKGFGDSDLARAKRAELPPLRPDTKLPPRIEQFLKETETNALPPRGARTIVVPQTVQPARHSAPAPSRPAAPAR